MQAAQAVGNEFHFANLFEELQGAKGDRWDTWNREKLKILALKLTSFSDEHLRTLTGEATQYSCPPNTSSEDIKNVAIKMLENARKQQIQREQTARLQNELGPKLEKLAAERLQTEQAERTKSEETTSTTVDLQYEPSRSNYSPEEQDVRETVTTTITKNRCCVIL